MQAINIVLQAPSFQCHLKETQDLVQVIPEDKKFLNPLVRNLPPSPGNIKERKPMAIRGKLTIQVADKVARFMLITFLNHQGADQSVNTHRRNQIRKNHRVKETNRISWFGGSLEGQFIDFLKGLQFVRLIIQKDLVTLMPDTDSLYLVIEKGAAWDSPKALWVLLPRRLVA